MIEIPLSVIITVVMEGRSAKAFKVLSRISGNMTVKAVGEEMPSCLVK